MKSKIKLNLNDLKVESFITAKDGTEISGGSQASGVPTSSGATCTNTCASTCSSTCSGCGGGTGTLPHNCH